MKKTIGFVSLLVLLSTAACALPTTATGEGSPNGGSANGESANGGSSNGSGSGDVQGFVGTWKYVSGQGTLDCPTTGAHETAPGVGTVAITAGSEAGTIVTVASTTNCTLVYTVAGNVATVKSGQHCTIQTTDGSTGMTMTETRTPNTETVSLASGMLTYNANENDVLNEGTQTANCTLSGELSYTKL